MRENIASDIEKAHQIIDNRVGSELMNINRITLSEFERLFTKGMFRRALMFIIENFDQQVESWGNKELNNELPLGRKLDMFQRRSMIKGINHKAENHKEIRNMMYSLHDILYENDPDQTKHQQ